MKKIMFNTEVINKLEKKIYKFLKTCFLILLMLVASSIPIIIVSILGFDYQEMSTNMKLIYSASADIFVLGIVLLTYHDEIIDDFHNYFNKDFRKNLKKSLKYWFTGLIIMVISNIIIAQFLNNQITTNEETVRKLIQIAPWYMAFDLMIYAPLVEELIFRKSIRDFIDTKWLYVFVSGFIFGALHVVGSVSAPIDLLYLIPYCSLGFTFALLYYNTNNIFSTITIHSLHNTLALVEYLLLMLL